MKLSGNTVLITGGATGIGLALAEAFLREGNEILICGRRENKLQEAKKKLPQLHTRACDVSNAEERKSLVEWATGNFKGLNVLVNNAGIQRMIDLKNGEEELDRGDSEIRINFEAPVHLTALLVPHLKNQKNPVIMNVSSGLGFAPMAIMPIYCATKAAMHSYSLSLRYQLSPLGFKVFELIPPMVDTELDRGAREERVQAYRGISTAEYVQATMKGLAEDRFEIAVGQAQGLVQGSRANPDAVFQSMNKSHQIGLLPAK